MTAWSRPSATIESLRTGEPARCFSDLGYATLGSWRRERRVIGKAEVGGTIRFELLKLGLVADVLMVISCSHASGPHGRRRRPSAAPVGSRRQLVYSHNGSAVVMTMVAGEVVMRDGSALAVDERALRPELRARHPGIDAAIAATARLERYWRAMYQHVVATDAGFTRWVGNGR
jgi:hypothetical protein